MRPVVYSDANMIRTNADLRRAINTAAQRGGGSAGEWVRRALGLILAAATASSPLRRACTGCFSPHRQRSRSPTRRVLLSALRDCKT